jgi:tyrosyl-tRNA synthetase
VPDDAMALYYEVLLGGPPDAGLPAVAQKRRLAHGLTARFHGQEAADAAEARFDRVHVERETPAEIDEAPLPGGEDPVHLPALIGDRFDVSRAQARRLLAQGGVRLDGEVLEADDLDLPASRLDGAVLQLGKRRFVRLRAGAAAGP